MILPATSFSLYRRASHAPNDESSPSAVRSLALKQHNQTMLEREAKMSPENANQSPESDVGSLNLEETKLTLGLPGVKRGFSVDLNLGDTSRGGGGGDKRCSGENDEMGSSDNPPASKARVVGWPPVRLSRKNVMKSCKYVKVAVDGAPYLRKVDLEMYTSYQQLLTALEDMFSCFTIRNYLNERKIMDQVNGVEYVPTYEDKDGDWMLVGDVPWKMFVESCKRLRLMKSSEAIGLAPRTPPKNSCTS